MIEFLLKHEKKIVIVGLSILFIMGVMFFSQPSNTTATGNAKVDNKKTVTASSDTMSGNAKKIGNVGHIDGDLAL